jgi:hypothetical protein
MALELQHATKAQLLATFRAYFALASKGRLAELSAWVLYRMDVGDLDDDEVRAVFGYAKPEWNALVKRMRELVAAHALVEDARGE